MSRGAILDIDGREERLGFINVEAFQEWRRRRETATLEKLLVDVCNMGQMLLDCKRHIEIDWFQRVWKGLDDVSGYQEITMNDFAEKYLSHYGYLASGVKSASVSEETADWMMQKAITEFQETAGLPPSGELDAATEAKMHNPRCGCLDVSRAVVEWARWRKTKLTYFIEKRVGGLPASEVDELIGLAWNDWMLVADISISPVLSVQGADIIISTGSGRGDGFDGPSGTLAWAYLPNGSDGQLLCRFDLGETWVKEDPRNGILLRNVACHEFGHLLGLEHSRVSSALMAPFYSPSIVSPRQSDDIPRIVSMYGKATLPPMTPPGSLPLPNMIRLTKDMVKGIHGDFVLGSSLVAGDYDAILTGDGPPPAVP